MSLPEQKTSSSEKHEPLKKPVSLEQRIATYLSLPPEGQVNAWRSDALCVVFPAIVQRLLSPQGLEKYPTEARTVFFNQAIKAFSIFDLKPIYKLENGATDGRRRRVRDENGNYIISNQFIPAFRYIFENEKTIKKTDPKEEQTGEPLIRADIGAMLLLGMSLLDVEKAMSDIIRVSEPKKSRIWLQDHLKLLLMKNNPTRKWIIDNHIDQAAGHSWDSRIAELYLHLPDHIIDKKKGTPIQLPNLLVGVDIPTQLSEKSFLVFLDYALAFAQDLNITKRRAIDLRDFTISVRRLPKEFVMREDVQVYLRLINEATNVRQEEMKPGQAYDPAARQLLAYTRVRKYRWSVKDVLA